MQQLTQKKVYKVMFIFSGEGGGAKGAQDALPALIGDDTAVAEVIGGIDVDQLACQDFETWTGVKATQLDLFDRDQYIAWHGHEPPADWREATPDDMRRAAGYQVPDIVVITAPCKGFSGLLGKVKSNTAKYQALNRLAERGLFMALETWKPKIFAFENVKGITTRGAKPLGAIKKLLAHYKYLWHEDHYDCGEWGGLAQHRKRFKGFARDPLRVPCFIYKPVKQRVKAIGEVLELMPMPIDPDNPPADLDAAGGPMHFHPRLSWRTQVRLALIHAGEKKPTPGSDEPHYHGDWRDLNLVQPGEYSIVPIPWLPKTFEVVKTAELEQRLGQLFGVDYGREPRAGVFNVSDMSEPSPAITMGKDSNGNMLHVAEHRAPINESLQQPHMVSDNTHPHKYFVEDMADPGAAVTGARMGSGMAGVADHRAIDADFAYKHTPMGGGKGADAVQDMDDSALCVTGDPRPGKAGAASVVADYRTPHEARDGSHQVGDMNDSCGPVIGAAAVTSSNGIAAVAEHRHDRVAFGNMLKVTSWDEAAAAATAAAGPNQSGSLVADPRPTCQMRNGTMDVRPWDEPSFAATANGDMHAGGAAAVSEHRAMPVGQAPVWDCRIPSDDDRGVWYIISPHRDKKGRRCWHRALTTLELLALQGFPWQRQDGRPVVLAYKLSAKVNKKTGKYKELSSDRSWRDRIGNAWPPPAAAAVIGNMLKTLLASEVGVAAWDYYERTGILVLPPAVEEDRETA